MKKFLLSFGIFSGKIFRFVICSLCASFLSYWSIAQINYSQDFNNGCAPLTVSFTNTSSPPANYFRWSFGDGDTANTFNAVHVFSSPGWYSSFLEGWDTTGGGMIYMGMKNGPQIQVGGSSGYFYMSTGTTACPGESVSFYTYDQYNNLQWDFGDSTPKQNWNWPQHLYNDTGIYNVTLIISTFCDTDTIVQSITITNTSIPFLVAQTNQNPVCPNDAVYFSTQNNYQAASYFWSFGDGNNSTASQPIHSFASTGNYEVIFTVTNLCGNQNSDTTLVNVQNGIYPNTGTNIWQNPSCPYSAVSFGANGSGTSYHWDFGDNATDSTRNTQHFFTDTGNFPVEFIIANGCGNSDTMNFNVSVQFNPGNKPNAQIYFEGFWGMDTIIVCPGEEVDFRNNTWNNGSSPNSFLWYFGDGDSSETKDATHLFSISDTFSVQMIASNTCGGKDTALLWVIASISASPNSSLEVFPPEEMAICPGEMVIFSDRTEKSIEETGYSYSIWFGDGDSTMDISSYSDTNLRFIATHNYLDTGVFQYTFEVENSCGNKVSLIDTVIVSNPLSLFMPFAGNSAEPDSVWDNSACPGDAVQFYSLGGISFSWDFGDGQSDTGQFPTHTYATTGTYNALVLVTNACGETDTAFTIAEVSNTNIPDSWFSMDKNLVSTNDTVTFYNGNGNNESSINYNWDFGDGNFSTAQNPFHGYSFPGIYTVTLSVSNGCGSSSSSQNISVVYPVADFSFAFSNNGCTPEVVLFTNLSLYADSFKWDFGDFSPNEFVEDPFHGYGWASTFMVTLTAYNFLTGDSDKISKPIIIKQTPLPGWASFWANPNPVCPDDVVAFNSFMFPPPTSVIWYFGDGDSSSMLTPNHQYTDTGNFFVTHIGFNACGSDTNIQILDVDSAAPINASLWANPATACPGQQIDFNNSTFPAPLYSIWTFGDGDSAFSFNAAHAYDDTGTYFVTLIAYSSCNSDTATTIINMDTTLIPWVMAFSNNDTACAGDVINFTGNGNNLVGYNWNFDDGFSSLQQNPSHSFSSNGSYDVVFTGTNSCGNSNMDTVTVAIINNAPPDAFFSSSPFSFCGGFSNICPGTDVYFTNTSVNSVASQWDFGDSTGSALESPVHSYADTGNYNVRLIATSSCGGYDTVFQCVRVSNDVVPSAWFCYNPFCFPSPVCFGTEITFINWSTDTTNVLWDFGDGTASTLSNPSHIYTDTGSYTIILQVTNNCGNTANSSQTINVTNNVPPSANLSAWPNVTCPGENVNFNAFGMSTSNYFWNFGDGDTITSSNNSIDHPFDNSGNYNVMMVAFNGCGSDTNYFSITVKPGALAGFTFDTVCFGDTTFFADASSPTPDNWAWDFGDGNTSSAQNPSHEYSPAGIYQASLTATLNGCVDNISYNIPVIEINLSVVGTDASCNNFCDGTASILAMNGIVPYSYWWSNGQTNSSATGLCAGNYSVTVTDATGCSDSISVVINEPVAISYSSVVAGLICFGTTDGSIDLQPASIFYSYYWNTTDTTEDISSLSGATYYVTITDTNSCYVVDTFLVEESPVFSLTESKTNISCFGANNGTASVSVSGSTSPFTYLWSESSTTASIDSLSVGSYTVTVTDTNGCTVISSVVNISQPTALTSSATKTDATCNGTCTGTLDASGSGGTTPYSYSWSGGLGSGATKSGVCAGNYNVTVSDFNGCTTSASATVTQPAILVVSVSGNNVSCNGGDDGDATSSASGGTSPYTYLWSDSSTAAINDSLIAGTYYVTTTDANGCTDADTLSISQPTILSVSVSGNNVSCNGGNNGSATLTVNGGVSPYTYVWSNAATTEDIFVLTAGTYKVTVTDGNACVDSATAVVSQPAVLALSTDSVRAQGYSGTCDGEIFVLASGGTVPYVYIWNNGDTTSAIDSLCAGIFEVTVTDSDGCNFIDTIILPILSPLTISISGNDVSCNGGIDGDAIATANGGMTPYSYAWSNGESNSSVSGLLSSIYSVTITDAYGNSTVNSITISEPSALTASFAVNDVSCNGGYDGDAIATVGGGTSPYSYVWSDASTAATNDSLIAGTYYLTTTDANGCADADTVSISQPTVLSVAVSGNNASCFGGNNGSATLTVNGGTSPYAYLWSDASTAATNDSLIAGTYYLTTTDANGCTDADTVSISQPTALSVLVSGNNVSCFGGNNGNATATATEGTSPYTYLWSDSSTVAINDSLIAGTYYVTTTDVNGCNDADSVTISQPTVINISFTSANPGCGNSDGQISVSASGGASGFTYLWSNGQSSATATGLSSGTHTVTVTDSTGCFELSTVNLSNAGAPVLSVATTNISCNGINDGSIDLSVSGGTSPYTFLWSNGTTSEDLDSLAGGNYFVTVTDGLSCLATANANISEPLSLSAIVYSTGISCFGVCDATVGVMVTGGVSPYSYLWNNSAATQSMTGMCAGNYMVTVTDANGCISTDSGNLSQPSAFSASANGNDASCNSSCDGYADAIVTGGTSPFAYLWSNGQTSLTTTGLCAGNYNVTTTDFNGCTSTTSVTINEPSLLTVSAAGNDVSCNGGNDGNASAFAGGGTSPYSFLWGNGASTANLQGVSAGTYYVTITDTNACTANDSVLISEPVALAATSTANNATCYGGDDGSASLSVSGGTSPYNYLWSNGQTSANATGLTVGSYFVTATDFNGCTISSGAIVNEPPPIVISSALVNPACGASDGEINVTVSGGTSPYSYFWNDSSSTTTISGLSAGSYSITVTDSNSCAHVETIGLGNFGAPSLSAVITHILCNGGNNGAIDLIVSGGTSPYTYIWDNSDTTEDISNLSGGMYVVSVTDAIACIAITNETVSEPPALAVDLSVINASCSGTCDGSISANAYGGVSPYTYLWGNSSTDTLISGLCGGAMNNLTVTDANSCVFVDSSSVTEPTTLVLSVSPVDATCFGVCNGSASVNISGGTSPYSYLWNNGNNSSNADSLCAGGYSVTVTDVSGCLATDSAAVNEPTVITISVAEINASCNGICDGSVSISAFGGNPPYTYSGDGTNLCAGIYPVMVTDAYGCTVYDSSTVAEPTPLSLNISGEDVSCNGSNDGALTATVSGGTSPFTYLWSNAAAICCPLGVGAGTYSITVVDSKGCQVEDSAAISEPSAITVSVTSTDASCSGFCDGAVSINASGGTSPYTYSGEGSGLCAGNYPITVTDINGCSTSDSATVSEPAAIIITIIATGQPLCYGECDGILTASVLGGLQPYSYLWSNTQAAPSATALCAGTYICTVTDSNACTASVSATISQFSEIFLSLSATQDSGSANGTTNVSTAGGTPPFSYLWENSQTDSTATGLSAGNYSVTVTDANGCSEFDSVEVTLYVGIQSQYSIFHSPYSIYPNPVRNEMNLKVSMLLTETVRIVLINTLGQETTLFNRQIDKGDNTLKFDTEKLSTGVYYLLVNIGENNPEFLRFVKTR